MQISGDSDMKKLSELDAESQGIAYDAISLTGLSWVALTEQNRKRRVVYKRWAAWKIFRDHGYSYQEIGEIFGRDHTSILWGLRRLGGSKHAPK